MYKYLYAVGRYKNFLPGFHNVDISKYSVADLEKLFDILTIVIDDTLYKKDIAIQLQEYRIEFLKHPDKSIQQWLDLKGSEPLITSQYIPENKKSFVKLENLFTHGYFHYPANINLANDSQKDQLSDNAPDVLIKHYHYENIDYGKLNSNSLFLADGVFYRTVARKDGIYVLGLGNDYVAKNNDLKLSAFNFQKIGTLKTLPITPGSLIDIFSSTWGNKDTAVLAPVLKPDSTEQTVFKEFKVLPPDGVTGEKDYSAQKRYHIDTGIDLTNKTVWLVINGNLVVDETIVYPVSGTRIAINLGSWDPLSHYKTYSDYTRTPELKLFSKYEEYKKEALLSHNSFLVIIDNPTVGVELTPLTSFTYPNVFHTEERFPHPLLLENGLFPLPYVKTYGVRQRLLNVDLRMTKKYVIETTGVRSGSDFVNKTISNAEPGKLPKGYLFKIFGIKYRSNV